MASENLSPTRLVCGIGDMWNDGRIIYLRGWVIAPGASVATLEADLPSGREPVPHTPAPGRTDAVFYSLLVTGTPMVRITLRATTPTGETMLGELDLLNPNLPDPDPEAAEYAISARALEHLKHEVNTRKLDLLELGSRVLADTPSPWREAFSGAASYKGFDIHAGPGVDVVGDAHRLSSIVGRASADAIFSVAVLEHIAMPWIVAREINRTLRPGGLVHITTHQTWPIHERPNDFWRFSDVAMKLLFGPMHGFEVVECGMYGRLSLHHRKPSADYAELPFNVAYSTVFILARKAAEIDALPAEPGERELAELSRLYPPPTNI